jgi:photosystem II stability/assembly factor-like uncharacterized protein
MGTKSLTSATAAVFFVGTSLLAQSKINGITWLPIGPAPVAGGQTFGSRVDVSGRATVIAVNPSNADDVWLGTANGGVWHSTNGGINWRPMSDYEESLAIGSIALSGCGASGCSVIYAGTGENAIRRDTYYGAGLLIGSTSGGEFPTFTWSQTGRDIFRFGAINNVVLDRTTSGSSQRIYVALSSGVTASATESTVTAPAPGMGYGIFKSDNNGATWAKLTVPGTSAAKPSDLEIDPQDANTLYAGFMGVGIFKTQNAGGTWCPLNPGIALPAGCAAATGLPNPTVATFDRVEIALRRSSAGSPATLYAMFGNCPDPIGNGPNIGGGCSPAIYKSTDSGGTWTLQTSTAPTVYSRYSPALTIHPTDPTIVYLAGYRFNKSTNSAQSFVDIGNNTLHPDHHAVVFPDPANPMRIYDASDGGFAYSTDGGMTWTSGNDDLQTIAFQSISSSPLTGRVIGGTQDNGTELWKGLRKWDHVDDGDSSSTLIGLDSPMNMFDNYFEACPRRSQSGGMLDTWSVIINGINTNSDCQYNTSTTVDPAAAYPPFVQGPSSPFPLYFGTNRLYSSANNGTNWTAISPALGGTGTFYPDINRTNVITAIAVAPTNSNRIYLGYYDGQIWVTDSACTLTSCWTSIGGSAKGLPNTVVTRIAVHPADANTAYVTYSGFGIGAHVYKTTNGGATWSPAAGSGGNVLPDVPTNTISIEPSTPNNLWLGTDSALMNGNKGSMFKSTDGGASWVPFSSGLPNSPIYEISIDETHGRVFAGTHGRGVFVLTQPFLTNYEGWVNNSIWDIPVYGNGFIGILPQTCTMNIIRQDGTSCASGSTDAMGGTIQVDNSGTLVTSNGSRYNGMPVAWACFNGTCLNGTPIASCNQPGNPVTTVTVTCGGLVGIDKVLNCPQQNNPPSTSLGFSGLPGAPVASSRLGGVITAGPQASFDVIASVQAGDGTTRALCNTSVPFQSGEQATDILMRARDALNSSPACMATTVRAAVAGVAPQGVNSEDALGNDPRLLISAPGASGGQLVTSVHAGPGRATGSCFNVRGLGVPVLDSLTIMRLRLETSAGGASGGEVSLRETSDIGTCAITVPTSAGNTANQIASALSAAFQAPGIPGPNPGCPSRTNPRDVTLEGDSIITVMATALEFCSRDPGVGFVIAPEELALDTIPPTTVATANPPPNVNGWNNTSVTVIFNATDNPGGTGVKNVQYVTTGAQSSGGTQVISGSTASVTISNEGITDITYFATDNFGNQERPKTLTVRIDRTPPLVGGLPAPNFCTLWPPDHRMVPVGATFAIDFLSGPDPSSYTVTASSNEPDSGTGPGDLSPDIIISGVSVQLRAERSDTGTGRVYTISGTARDLAGNLGTCTVTCKVPLR